MEREALDFHIKVVEGYRKLAAMNSGRIHRIDGNLSIEEIHRQIITEADKIIS